MRVLQNFHTYLKTTENWSYNLINSLQDTDIVIASKQFEKCNFYNPRFKYIEFPLLEIDTPTPSFAVRKFNKFVRSMVRNFYPAYIGRFGGKIDLMHSHFSFVGWEYRNLAHKLKIPHVISFYGFDYEWLPYNKPKWINRYQKLFKKADLFICEGVHGASILSNAGCPSSKIMVSRLGVNTSLTKQFKRKKHVGELKLLQIASLTEKKGHRYTIEAFLAALERNPEMSLTIVGRDFDALKQDLLNNIDPSLLGNKIYFQDQIDFLQLHDFMSDYHVFIHPSCYAKDRDCEGGAPVVLLDAQATGMPIIASTHCDIPSIVIDGTTGFLAAEKDSSALSTLISRFYNMGQQEYDHFSDAARRHVEQEYDIRTNAALLRDIYQKLIFDHRNGS